MFVSTAGAPRLSTAALLDWAERLGVLGLFSWLVYSKVTHHETGVFLYLYCLSEGLVVLFILVRRATENVTPRPLDWALAITATLLPMLVGGQGTPLLDANVLMGVVFVGVCFQLWAKLVLRRSFGIVAANRGVKITGPYRIVRHPMYAGYLITHIGMLLTSPTLLNASIYTGAWIVQIARLLAEERLLTQDAVYQAYCAEVRYRLIPGLF
jgi:protein-S-isoprenylcysteine O-methyltransferase Ste14